MRPLPAGGPPKRLVHLRAGTSNPGHVPSAWILTTSTACSAPGPAGLLRPACGRGVRRVLPRRSTLRRVPLASSRTASLRPLPPCRFDDFEALLHCRVRCRERAVAGSLRSLLPWACSPSRSSWAPLPPTPRGVWKRVAAVGYRGTRLQRAPWLPAGGDSPSGQRTGRSRQRFRAPTEVGPCRRSLSGAGVASSRSSLRTSVGFVTSKNARD
jgi:hypothetical protein